MDLKWALFFLLVFIGQMTLTWRDLGLLHRRVMHCRVAFELTCKISDLDCGREDPLRPCWLSCGAWLQVQPGPVLPGGDGDAAFGKLQRVGGAEGDLVFCACSCRLAFPECYLSSLLSPVS